MRKGKDTIEMSKKELKRLPKIHMVLNKVITQREAVSGSGFIWSIVQVSYFGDI